MMAELQLDQQQGDAKGAFAARLAAMHVAPVQRRLMWISGDKSKRKTTMNLHANQGRPTSTIDCTLLQEHTLRYTGSG